MRLIFCAATLLLVLVMAACTTPEERAAKARLDAQRASELGSFEECVDNAGEDVAKVEACQSLQPGPALAQ